MLKLPKGLKKKKKKSKKDQELFTEEELEQYKRDLKAKQEAAANKSDAGESDAASDFEGLAAAASATTTTTAAAAAAAGATGAATTYSSSSAGVGVATPSAAVASASRAATSAGAAGAGGGAGGETANGAAANKTECDEEWAKFKQLTSGVDTILHKTQDELHRIKKESFYQRLPSAAEKKRQEEAEAAAREAKRLEEERRKAAEFEAQRDKLAEAVVELSESESDFEGEVDDIFATDYIEAITSGEIQLAVVPDSPVLELNDGPDPFDTAYAEKVIVGADKAKGNKKLVSLGAAVEVLSGRVDREHALALAKPKRKQRKGIQNLLLSESVDLADIEQDIVAVEPERNLLDVLDDEIPESDAPIDLSVSLHLQFNQSQKPEDNDNETECEVAKETTGLNPDLAEFDALKDDEDDEFAELAAESLAQKEEIKVVSHVELLRPTAEVITQISDANWAEFAPSADQEKGKPARPPPPVRPATGPHIVLGAIYVSDEEEQNFDDDPFNTTYADQVIKKTTVLEEDDSFDPRAEEAVGTGHLLAQPNRDLLGGSATDLSKVGPSPIAPTLGADDDAEPADFDPFDTSLVTAIVQPKATELKFIERELLPESNLKHSLSDPDFDPRAEETELKSVQIADNKPTTSAQSSIDFDTARRKSSLSLNIQSKCVGFLVPDQSLLGAGNEASINKKPLTPYYAPTGESIVEKDAEDPFDTSYVPAAKLSDVELKHIEVDFKAATTFKHSLSDPNFDPRAPPTPVPAEVLLSVEENINTKVLTPAQESKDLVEEGQSVDPFDTSIASNLQLGKTELKLLESELLPEKTSELVIGVLDTQTDAQELGLGGKVLTPCVSVKNLTPPEDVDPFDTSIAENLVPGQTEIKLLESELIER